MPPSKQPVVLRFARSPSTHEAHAVSNTGYDWNLSTDQLRFVLDYFQWALHCKWDTSFRCGRSIQVMQDTCWYPNPALRFWRWGSQQTGRCSVSSLSSFSTHFFSFLYIITTTVIASSSQSRSHSKRTLSPRPLQHDLQNDTNLQHHNHLHHFLHFHDHAFITFDTYSSPSASP